MEQYVVHVKDPVTEEIEIYGPFEDAERGEAWARDHYTLEDGYSVTVMPLLGDEDF